MRKGPFRVAALLTLLAAADPAAAQSVWRGRVASFGFELHIALRVTTVDGTREATLDVIDYRTRGLEVAGLDWSARAVRFRVPALAATFTGELVAAAPRRIVGRWQQGDLDMPVTLRAVDSVADWPARPQHPDAETPYAEREVAFHHVPEKGLDASFGRGASRSEDAVSIAGTLTIPSGPGPHPTVVLVSGSGPHDRDGAIRGHRPFLVLADHLTRRGFAVLRTDDRGVGASTGTLAGATTLDLAEDTRAALRFVHSREDLDPERTGLVGHSEGGMIAALVAGASDADSQRVRFVVSLAGPAVDGANLLLDQARDMATAKGRSGDDVYLIEELTAILFDALLEHDDREARRAAMTAAARGTWSELSQEFRSEAGDRVANLESWALSKDDPWLRFILTYDPERDLRGVACPILVLFGTRDLHVDPALNVPTLRAAFEGKLDATVIELEGLNHLFQRCETGTPSEYAWIEETLAPAALDAITAWLTERFGS